MSYAQVASNAQVCVASNVASNVAKKATNTYVQQKVTNKKITPYTGDLVCSPYRGSSRKPYCAVCFKAGKPIEIYTNHFTKSSLGPDAVVVCPTILAAQCSYCKKTGHFKSVCPILEQKEKEKNNQCSLPLIQRSLPLVQRTKPSISAFSAFAALDVDSDDEDDITDITEDCDTISTNISCIPTVITYASVCASVKIPISCNKSSIPQDFVVISPTKNTNKNLTHSWADDDYWNDEE